MIIVFFLPLSKSTNAFQDYFESANSQCQYWCHLFEEKPLQRSNKHTTQAAPDTLHSSASPLPAGLLPLTRFTSEMMEGDRSKRLALGSHQMFGSPLHAICHS